MKIFITGATGFIGQAFCRVALERGHRLLALCRSGSPRLPPEVEIAVGSMAEIPWSQIERFAPDAVLHLAWLATPGVYLTSPENDLWREQSQAMFERFREIDVSHIAGTGTCIEYAASDSTQDEETSPLAPTYPYSKAKVDLYHWMQKNLSGSDWTWFRIFYPYGPGEHPARIASALIKQLRAGQPLSLRTPHSTKDYIFIDDLARGLCMALESKLTGAVNVCTGKGVTIEHIAGRIARLLGVSPALVAHADPLAIDPTPTVIGCNARLRSTGWCPATSLDEGLNRLVMSLHSS